MRGKIYMYGILSVGYIKNKISIDYTKDIIIKNKLNYYIYGYMSCCNYYYLKEKTSIFINMNKRIKNKIVLICVSCFHL